MIGGLGVGWLKVPAVFGLLMGLGGLIIVGPLGGAVGLIAGAVAARRPPAVLLAAAAALIAAAAFTLLEQPLTLGNVYGFPQDHSLANSAGAIAAVLLLGGLVAVLVQSDRAEASVPVRTEEPRATAAAGIPSSAIAALIAAFVGAVALRQLGDRTLETPALALVAIAVLALAVLLLAPRLGWRS